MNDSLLYCSSYARLDTELYQRKLVYMFLDWNFAQELNSYKR